MKKRILSAILMLAMVLSMLPMAAMAATSDPDNGDWSAQSVTLKNTSEAELMVRVGDIDNCGFGYPEYYNPFTAETQTGHGYPWDPDPADWDGTDRIMMGTGYKGDIADGYSGRWTEDPAGTTTRPIKMSYDASGITVKSALLQILVDDFQAPVWKSNFTVTINGKDAPFVAEVLNHIEQTGPSAFIASVDIPGSFSKEIESGSLSIYINDATTGMGDGFAIDFVKLLVNYNRSKYISTVSGFVMEGESPLAGATVRVLGTKNTVKTGATGNFTAEVIAGLNVFRASKDGYVEEYAFATVPSGQTLNLGQVSSNYSDDIVLHKGQGTADIDYWSFADGDSWSNASAWATENLQKASDMGLIPDVLMNADLTKSITRAEFAAVCVKTYENLSGLKAIPAVVNPFKDTAGVEVLKAYNTGLMAGVSADKFDPDKILNREQAATALTNVFKRVSIQNWQSGVSYSLTFTMPAKFADDDKISSWAKESVYFMVANGVISGMGGNTFAPKNTTSAQEAQHYADATREQALVIAVKMVENLKGKSADYSVK